MSEEGLTIPDDEHEAVEIKVLRVGLRFVTIAMRVRTDKNWLFLDQINLEVGQKLIVVDGQKGDQVPVGIVERVVPRGKEEGRQ